MTRNALAISPQRLLDALRRESLACFCETTFPILVPGGELLWNWHHDALCTMLERVERGEIKRLLIEAPPRSLKSVIVSVLFPAWLLAREPGKKVIGASYSLGLATKLHNDCRTVMRSARYRSQFPASAIVGKDSEIEFTTAARGGRYVTSPDGTLTGRGGGVLILDDILSAKDAHSTPRREGTNEWLRTTAMSRLDDKRTGAIIVCCQRLHVGDLPGALREAGGWTKLSLPAIAQIDETFDIGAGRSHLYRTGDLLHPEREPREVLDELKTAMGLTAFVAQYLQQPVPADGTSIKWPWFRRYDTVPHAHNEQFVQRWDIATSTGDGADYSACTTWCVIGADCYLVDVLRGRWDFPTLLKQAGIHAIKWNPNTILIEEAGIGQSFLQQYNAGVGAGQRRAIGVRPDGNKITRLETESPVIASGHVLVPNRAPWLDEFRREITEFPNGRHDDQVDSLSQFLKWQRGRSVPGVRVMKLTGY